MGLRPAEHQFLDASLAARTADERARHEEEQRTTNAEQRAQYEEWRRNLDAIGELQGLRVRLEQMPFDESTTDAATGGTDADVFTVAATELRDLEAARPLLDLRPFVEEAALLNDYGAHLVAQSRIGDDGTWPSDTGRVHAVIVDGSSKTVVWTKEPEFTDFGYAAPTDWDSFMALADTIVADGRTPFCLGVGVGAGAGAGPFSGWPATDWVEAVVLRTAGPDFYQSWIDHEVPFDDPVVVDAIRNVGEMVHRPGYVSTNPATIARQDFSEAIDSFVNEPGACLMTPFPCFMPSFGGAGAVQAIGTFAFPTFGPTYGDAVVGTVGLAAAVTDRPEIRTFMAALASPDWGRGSAQLEWPGALQITARFDAAAMVNPVMGEIVSGVQAAIRSNELRLDASDSMPPEIWSAFNAGMMRLFEEGSLENLDQLSLDIAADIEAAWP